MDDFLTYVLFLILTFCVVIGRFLNDFSINLFIVDVC